MASERPAAATSLAGSIISAMRLHQWSKNFLIFVPLIISHEFDLANIRDAAIAFFSFSLVASATYIFNDILDREVDELHETKRLRPFASGDLQPSTGWFVIVPLLLLGAGLEVLLEDFAELSTNAQLRLSAEIKVLTLPTEMGENFKCLGLMRGALEPPAAFGRADRIATLG